VDRRLLKGFLCLIYYFGAWISSTAKRKRPKPGLAHTSPLSERSFYGIVKPYIIGGLVPAMSATTKAMTPGATKKAVIANLVSLWTSS
jgi:hypothetical protein